MGSVFGSIQHLLKTDTSSSEPNPKAPRRLPRYLPHNVLHRLGFPKDLIATLRPDTTHIGYHADQKNLKAKAKHEFNEDTPHIPSYMEGTYAVEGAQNPAGSGPMHQVTQEQQHKSPWHMTRSLFQQIWNSAQAPQRPEAFQKTLDLPQTPRWHGDTKTNPYLPNYLEQPTKLAIVEISFNRVGTPQVKTPKKRNTSFGTKRRMP